MSDPKATQPLYDATRPDRGDAPRERRRERPRGERDPDVRHAAEAAASGRVWNRTGTDRRRSPEDVRPEPMAAVGEIAAPTRHEPDPEPADFPDYDDAFLAMVNDMDVVPEDVDSDESVKKDVQTRIRKMDLCGAFFTDGWGQEAMCILPTPCERHASEDVRGADVGDALAEARKALRCLYIAVDESVARDVEAKAEAAFAALRSPEPAAEPRDMGDGQ